jgi:hypothetical protein
MKLIAACVSAASILSFSVLATSPGLDGLTPIEPEIAKKFGKILSDEADKIEKPQVKISADPEKASGVHVPEKVGTLIVPQKDLVPGEELAQKFKQEKGASLAYLFLHRLTPVVNGTVADVSRLHAVKLTDDNGQQHTVYLLLLSVRQLGEDDYRLYAYGHEDKPLVEARFAEGTGPGPEPTAVEVKEIDEQAKRGTMTVTVFGKYQASFPIAQLPE